MAVARNGRSVRAENQPCGDLRPYRHRSAWRRVARVVSYWFPFDGHPDGASDLAWFRVVDGWGFRTESNPAGPSESPCFRMIDGFAYPTLSLPNDVPTFEIIGSFVYAATGTAWFRIDERARLSVTPNAR
jgi:hypothetical protein